MDAAQKEQELHKGVTNSLNQLGHSETVQSVNPNDYSILEKIGKSVADTTGEAVDIAGAPVDQFLRGEASHIGLRESKSWSQRLMERAKRKFMPLRRAA